MNKDSISIDEKLTKLAKLETTIYNTIGDFDADKISNLSIKDLQILMMLVKDTQSKLQFQKGNIFDY